MTPSQMLMRLPKEQAPTPPINWQPAPRTKPIEIPQGGVSAADLLFMEQSAALQMGKCPLCHAPVDQEVTKDQMVYFRCTRMPVYHEWRRSLSFITQD